MSEPGASYLRTALGELFETTTALQVDGYCTSNGIRHQSTKRWAGLGLLDSMQGKYDIEHVLTTSAGLP